MPGSADLTPAGDVAAMLRFDPDEGLADLTGVLAALATVAGAAGFRIDRHAIANDLHAATFRCIRASRVALRVSPGGAIAVAVRDG